MREEQRGIKHNFGECYMEKDETVMKEDPTVGDKIIAEFHIR